MGYQKLKPLTKEEKIKHEIIGFGAFAAVAIIDHVLRAGIILDVVALAGLAYALNALFAPNKN